MEMQALQIRATCVGSQVLANGTDLADYLTITNISDGLQREFVPVNQGGKIVWQIRTTPVADEEAAQTGSGGGSGCFATTIKP